jgi:hypothetical protein
MTVEGTAQDTPTKGEILPEHHEKHRRRTRKSISLKYGY